MSIYQSVCDKHRLLKSASRFLITVFLGSVVHSSNAKDVEEKLKFKDGGDEDFDTGTEEFII
uniref:Uncharacterized protein n=1 Tax=Oryza glumipatula TaxID=40148 RepID=A0A0E0AC53_9ORYZ